MNKKCCICGKKQEGGYHLWSVMRGNDNVVCDACIKKAKPYCELEQENERLKKSNETRRQYEVQVCEEAVWQSNFQKHTRDEYGRWTIGVLQEIHRSVLRCNEELGDDGLCDCMRHIGAILQQKHDLMTSLAQGDNSLSHLVEWVLERWDAEVKNRPEKNVYRKTLDSTWRQVYRKLTGEELPRED